MLLGVLKETFPGEVRVSLIPASLPQLAKKEFQVIIEQGAGEAAGYSDAEYQDRGATVAQSRDEVFEKADVILCVRGLGANPDRGAEDLSHFRKGQAVVGQMEALSEHDAVRKLAETGVTAFALELMPRITRAQSMDILSSMATIAGYKAVLMAANEVPRMFPLLMTAAGTIKPAKAFIIGAGVAGLQAIATARRLGAQVHAYDVRPAVKEQVESLGAKFVELDLKTEEAEDARGYSKDLGEEFLQKQREMMTHVISESDIVVTTAAIPGKKAPILVTADMVKAMKRGSVVLDLAAERGGNCELTKPGETVDVDGVKVMGPLNVPARVPFHASQMLSQNVTTFLLHIYKDKELKLDDQITAETMITREGDIYAARIRELMGLPPLQETKPEPEG